MEDDYDDNEEDDDDDDFDDVDETDEEFDHDVDDAYDDDDEDDGMYFVRGKSALPYHVGVVPLLSEYVRHVFSRLPSVFMIFYHDRQFYQSDLSVDAYGVCNVNMHMRSATAV